MNEVRSLGERVAVLEEQISSHDIDCRSRWSSIRWVVGGVGSLSLFVASLAITAMVSVSGQIHTVDVRQQTMAVKVDRMQDDMADVRADIKAALKGSH